VIAFTVPGKPQAMQRARVTYQNGKARAYTPKETVAYQRDVKWEAKAAGARVMDGLVVLTCRFYGLRGDGDNALKAVADALQGICYNDDRQIVEGHYYVERAGKPARTEVEVRSVGEDTAVAPAKPQRPLKAAPWHSGQRAGSRG